MNHNEHELNPTVRIVSLPINYWPKLFIFPLLQYYSVPTSKMSALNIRRTFRFSTYIVYSYLHAIVLVLNVIALIPITIL